ncbi:hypothetical protein [Tardiphaga sp. 839_C3_N1_4]|uniref:hypothetical protein n=1 Tax=Tardiphaga sp. 839_C3_N1_4 TaxID=3240761 RepID=UPI003F27AE59
MTPDRNYLRTPLDAATTAARFGRDFQLASRLHAQGIKIYKDKVPFFLVDLATYGNLIEPNGVQLRHNKLFNSQAAIAAYQMTLDIEAFERECKPTDIVHIVLRPSPLLCAHDDGEHALFKNGRCSIDDLRVAQRAFNNSVQRALAELDRKQLLTPLLVARHLRPLKAGDYFDIHAHVVVQMRNGADWQAHEYLTHTFGSAQVWTSSLMEPDEIRSFARTSAYPVWRQANEDWNKVKDANLKSFFEQSLGLRSVDALGPFREVPQAESGFGERARRR